MQPATNSKFSPLQQMWAQQLRAMIESKLNPQNHGGIKGGTAARKVHISTLFLLEDFLKLFPEAKKCERVKRKRPLKLTDGVTETICGEVVPIGEAPKFLKSKCLYKYSIKNVKELEKVFGVDWDIVHNGKNVGFACLPITVRFTESKVTNFKQKRGYTMLSRQVEWKKSLKMTSLNISMGRSYLCCANPDESENYFLQSLRHTQITTPDVLKSQRKYYSKKNVIIESK